MGEHSPREQSEPSEQANLNAKPNVSEVVEYVCSTIRGSVSLHNDVWRDLASLIRDDLKSLAAEGAASGRTSEAAPPRMSNQEAAAYVRKVLDNPPTDGLKWTTIRTIAELLRADVAELRMEQARKAEHTAAVAVPDVFCSAFEGEDGLYLIL